MNVCKWIAQNRIVPEDFITPVTLEIEAVEWEPEEGGVFVYFRGINKPFEVEPDDGDSSHWRDICAVTGFSKPSDLVGRSLRLYPVTHPKPHIEIF